MTLIWCTGILLNFFLKCFFSNFLIVYQSKWKNWLSPECSYADTVQESFVPMICSNGFSGVKKQKMFHAPPMTTSAIDPMHNDVKLNLPAGGPSELREQFALSTCSKQFTWNRNKDKDTECIWNKKSDHQRLFQALLLKFTNFLRIVKIDRHCIFLSLFVIIQK